MPKASKIVGKDFSKEEITKAAPQAVVKAAVQIPSLEEFLQAGAHFGHQTSRWNPKMAKYIYTQRNGIHIIDLVKTVKLLKVALDVIQTKVDEGAVLLVGTKGQAATLVQQVAVEKGAFYINNRWPGGLFTNFEMISKSVNKLIRMEEELAAGAVGYTKNEALLLGRDVARLNKLYEGIKFMDRLPKLVIVIDSKIEKNAIRECKNAGIPVVALIDTNCDPELVDYAIPANDDSLKSISLFSTLFGKALEGGKASNSVIALRKGHEAKVEALAIEYKNKADREAAFREQELRRIKELKEGKITPEEVAVESSVVRVVKAETSTDSKIVRIEDLGIGARAISALQAAGYLKASQLKSMTLQDLKAIKGIGEKVAEEIMEAVKNI